MPSLSDFSGLRTALKDSKPDFHKTQAQHNFVVAKHLVESSHSGACVSWDWVVTISYYSALHYAHAGIDGIRDSGICHFALSKPHYGGFDSLVKELRSIPRRVLHEDEIKTDRHAIIAALIHDNFGTVDGLFEKFKYLQDKAHNARYHQYQEKIDGKMANRALGMASDIQDWWNSLPA